MHEFMKTVSLLFPICLFFTLAAATPVLAEGNISAGRQLAAQRCKFCHGEEGLSGSPLVPNHRGQQPHYFVRQLKAFRDGSRQDPMMSIQAGNLSDQDIENLAAYYSSLSCK